MNRKLVSIATVGLVLSPLVALGAIGAMFLASPNDRPSEFEPIAVDAIGPEPRLVPLYVSRRDAWMQVTPEPGGWVHVRRAASGEIIVLSANHPRMGDFISYESSLGCFRSDCFYSKFDLDGRWFHDPTESMYRVRDMLRLEARVAGERLFVRAPIPRATYFTERE